MSSVKEDLVFKALADETRRRILDLVRDRPKTTGQLCERFPDLDRCTVMQHLSVLARADLILAKREGRLRWNYLNPLPIKRIYDRWISRFSSGAVDLLAAVKDQLER